MKVLNVIFIALLFLSPLLGQEPANISMEDGNFKIAEPTGTGQGNYIERGQDITYTVFFQNTGTDTVYNLRVLDTLSAHLDIGSLREEEASHSFEMTIFDGNVVRFSFPNIRLPSRLMDEKASQGFVRFHISQKENLPFLTIIPNRAAIYFDFRPPTLTNVVYRTIADRPSPTDDVAPTNEKVRFFPHPVGHRAFVEITGQAFRQGELRVFSFSGQRLQSRFFSHPRFELLTDDLLSGLFFYKIYLDGQLTTTGHFMVK